MLWGVMKAGFKRHLQLNRPFENYAPWKTSVPRDAKGCSVKNPENKNTHRFFIKFAFSTFYHSLR